MTYSIGLAQTLVSIPFHGQLSQTRPTFATRVSHNYNIVLHYIPLYMYLTISYAIPNML